MKNNKLLIISLLGLVFGVAFRVEAMEKFPESWPVEVKIINATKSPISFRAMAMRKGLYDEGIHQAGTQTEGVLEAASLWGGKKSFSETLFDWGKAAGYPLLRIKLCVGKEFDDKVAQSFDQSTFKNRKVYVEVHSGKGGLYLKDIK